MFILLITAAVNAPSLRFEKNGILSCKKKNNSEENICRKIFFYRNDFIVYPKQYSKIVIEVKYYACPTSELNGWVIFVGKKSI
jgi:hypothetical protein